MTVEHLLFALLHDKRTTQILVRAGANIDRLRKKLDQILYNDIPQSTDKTMTPRPSRGFRRVLERAALHVESCGKNELLSEDLLVAIFAETDSPAATLLDTENISRLDIVSFIAHGSEHEAAPSDTEEHESPQIPDGDAAPESETDPLVKYAVNLNERAERGELEPLIGRDSELYRTIQVLARRRKNNPLLVGDAGVGKTAIVEGLAQRIQNGSVPEVLKGAIVWSLDLGTLVAGTKYRGEFENRVKGVLKSLEHRPNSILFLDEIHTVMGTGTTSGTTLDAANLLKPALSSSRIRCIGATTFEEYRQHIERDHALSRRFQRIEIGEPSSADTLLIISGLISKYEEYHEVRYDRLALESAVILADRYISDRKLPDKAIDVIDEAGADARLERGKGAVVDVTRIESVVARIAKIPPRSVSRDDRSCLINLEADINRVVFGQAQAVSELVNAVKLSRAGLRAVEKPIGSFLFTGPTGVGKTEVARQ
jgi:ATP-dependent Clp protease ATP-binding subunit ClpA